MGVKEAPKPLVGGEVAVKTSARTSTSDELPPAVAAEEAGTEEGDAKPSKSALCWLLPLLLCPEWLAPVELLRAGLFLSLGVAPSPATPGSVTLPGFFFFKMAKIEDSRSGKGGISSKTVA